MLTFPTYIPIRRPSGKSRGKIDGIGINLWWTLFICTLLRVDEGRLDEWGYIPGSVATFVILNFAKRSAKRRNERDRDRSLSSATREDKTARAYVNWNVRDWLVERYLGQAKIWMWKRAGIILSFPKLLLWWALILEINLFGNWRHVDGMVYYYYDCIIYIPITGMQWKHGL
jgi:hypothetical protein